MGAGASVDGQEGQAYPGEVLARYNALIEEGKSEAGWFQKCG